jgi:TonB family protein
MRYFVQIGTILAAGMLSAAAFGADTPSDPKISGRPVLVEESCTNLLNPALATKDAGMATVSYLIDTDGRVSDTRIDHSSGSKAIDATALTIYKSCTFKPALAEGKPVQAWIALKYFNAPD